MPKKIDTAGLKHFKDKENAMVASEFSASKSYAIGEYVYYKGTLYKFKAAHAAGAWTTADVDAVKLADDVSVLKESINNTLDDILEANSYFNLPFKTENEGYGIRFSTGELYKVTGFSTTDYIDVSNFDVISYKNVLVTVSTPVGMSFYDAEKVFISGKRVYPNGSDRKYYERFADLEVPQNAVYARFTVLTDTATYGDFEIHGFAKYNNEADNSKILAFDDDIPIPFFIVTDTYGIRYSTGEFLSNSNLASTNYIDISKYSELLYKRIKLATHSPTYGMAFYDKNKTYISGVACIGDADALSYELHRVTVPANAVYARFTTMIYWKEVEKEEPFELYGKSKLADKFPTESVYKKNIIFGTYSSDWYKARGDSYEGFTINTLYSDIVSAWDALMADSKGYITKETIGTASDNQTMYCYKLIPLRYRNGTGTSIVNNPPTFFIVPSIHGYEKSAAFGAYYFARDLVYNFDKDPVLNSIRTKCALYIVPVGNPYGFDNKTRKNANGVDLNRNWGVDPSGEDDPTSQYYPGAEPFDQPETQALKSIIDNNPNLFYLIDYHTNGQFKAESWANVNWMTFGYTLPRDTYRKNAYIAAQFQVSDISENLPIEYSLDTNGEAIGSITIGAETAPRPTIASYAITEKNIMGATFEGNNGLPSEEAAYSATEQKINSELLGNWIKNLLLVFKDVT